MRLTGSNRIEARTSRVNAREALGLGGATPGTCAAAWDLRKERSGMGRIGPDACGRGRGRVATSLDRGRALVILCSTGGEAAAGVLEMQIEADPAVTGSDGAWQADDGRIRHLARPGGGDVGG